MSTTQNNVYLVTEEDKQYFRNKYDRAIQLGRLEAAEKYRKQLEMVEDAIVIYRLTRKGTE